MKKIVICFSLAVVLIFQLQAQPSKIDKGFEISKNLEIFGSAYKNLQQNYVDDLEPGDLIKKGLDAMMSSLDPYTVFIPESDIEDVKMQVLGQYGGIGALIHQKDNGVYISEPYEGLPAQKAGLMAGDKIIEINGQSAETKKSNDVSTMLRGQAGTELKLKIDRNGKIFEKTIIREEIKMKPVPYSGIFQNDFGYIRLNEFTQGAGKDVQTAFEKLKETNPNLKGVVLDLRGNGGGLLNEAVNIVNLFVDKGQIVVNTKGKVAERNTVHMTLSQPLDLKIPVVVLVDGGSASASEIVAGSLQDFDRAVILGQRTYGKGLVQNIVPLTYNAQMKVTVAKYYIPSGRCVQAIDYSHRDSTGRPTKVPDSLKTAYKTKHGRTVYDGFGIEPDVETEFQIPSNIEIALIQKFLIFDFATEYYRTHPSIALAKDFEITDDIFSQFKNFIKDKDYSYSTATEKTIEMLKAIAEEEKYYEAIKSELAQMQNELKSEKNDDVERFKTPIKELLKEEILLRYYYQKGRIEGSLKTDIDLNKAIELFKKPEEFNKILSATTPNKK